MNEMHSITERDAFSYGFRLGVQLMAEAFLLPLGEDEEQQPKHRSGIGENNDACFLLCILANAENALIYSKNYDII